jgi:hypothetical protein
METFSEVCDFFGGRPTYEDWVRYYEAAMTPRMQPDVTYEEYREKARQQLERDRGAFTGETPLDAIGLHERGALQPEATFASLQQLQQWLALQASV